VTTISIEIDRQVTKILAPFKQLTKMGQERNTDLGSIGSVLWGFDILLEVLEKARKEFITAENKNSQLVSIIVGTSSINTTG
jgi:hypothetical protein